MRRQIAAALAIGTALAVCVGARAATTTAPATAPATESAAPDNAQWHAIIEKLSAGDFAQREAAQKELDAMDWRQLEFLRQAADAAENPEVKARLKARVSAIEEDLALNPAPLNLELKDATAADVADALAKALGTKVEAWPPYNNRNHDTFTISAREEPFWKIFLELSCQHGLRLQEFGDGLHLMSQGDQGWQKAVIVGPMAVVPRNIVRQRISDLQKDAGAELTPETMSIQCEVLLDPRMRVVKYSNPVFTEIIDDAGNTLYKQGQAQDNLWDANSRMGVQEASAALQIPEKKGTRIVSAKGSFHFVAGTHEEHIDVEDIEKKAGETFTIGMAQIRLTNFSVQGNGGHQNINITVTNLPKVRDVNGRPMPGPMRNDQAVSVQIFDANGTIVFSSSVRGMMGGGFGGNYTGPYKMRLSVATKTKDVILPFELKDLPLP